MLTDLLAEWGLSTRGPRPPVGVSACLLGDNVRYNGEHKRDATVADILSRHLTLRRYCPEVGIGLPVPRPPIQMVAMNGAHRVRGVEAPDRDYTDALHGYAEQVNNQLCGFVFKARSPSCALGTTPVFDTDNRETGLDDGAFTARLRQRLPRLPVCDEEALADTGFRRGFIAAVYLYQAWLHSGDRQWLARLDRFNQAHGLAAAH